VFGLLVKQRDGQDESDPDQAGGEGDGFHGLVSPGWFWVYLARRTK
jgi:hypothetical protein